MHPYPHAYVASAAGQSQGFVTLASPQLPSLATAPPPEFDGPGGVWSPETLLCASLADCFILTFRAVSRAARFEWSRLECRVEGVLERVGRRSQFTRYTTFARVTVPEGADPAKARELLERAEQGCLIANSVNGSRSLETEISVEGARRQRPPVIEVISSTAPCEQGSPLSQIQANQPAGNAGRFCSSWWAVLGSNQ